MYVLFPKTYVMDFLIAEVLLPVVLPLSLTRELCKADDITLDALEEAKITFIRSSYEEVQFVEELARCRAPSLKKLVIDCERRSDDGPLTKEKQEVCRMFPADVEVKFNVT
jgi:hypothetical protein